MRFFEIRNKINVCSVFYVFIPLAGIKNTNRSIANSFQNTFIEGERRAKQRSGFCQTGLGILFYEIDAHAAG